MKPAHVFLVSVLAVFAPLESVVLTVLALVLADFVFGVWASRVRKEPFQSAVLKRTIAKLAVYETALVFGFLTETYLTGSLVPFSKIVASFIGLTEFTSILENLNEISGQDILRSLISRLSTDPSSRKRD